MNIHPVLKEGAVIKLIFGIIVFVSVMSLVIILSQTNPIYPKKTEYIGAFTTGQSNISYFVAIQPMMDSGLIKVHMTEKEGWMNQSRAILKVPSDATDISFLLMTDSNLEAVPEKIAEQSYLTRVPYSTYENQSLAKEKGGVLIIRPDLIENYYGVEFYLPDLISQRSRSQITMSIPLYYAGRNIPSGLHQVTRYQVQIYLPENYELISSVPTPDRFKFIGDNTAFYEFDVNSTATDLLVNLENRLITRDIQNIQILLATLIGFSTSLIISQSIDIIGKKDELLRKHTRRRYKEGIQGGGKEEDIPDGLSASDAIPTEENS